MSMLYARQFVSAVMDSKLYILAVDADENVAFVKIETLQLAMVCKEHYTLLFDQAGKIYITRGNQLLTIANSDFGHLFEEDYDSLTLRGEYR